MTPAVSLIDGVWGNARYHYSTEASPAALYRFNSVLNIAAHTSVTRGIAACPHWSVSLDKGDNVVVRHIAMLPDAETGVVAEQIGRPWLIDDTSKGAVLRTLWLARETFIGHEARETFTYKGELVFNPHSELDV